jgi:hypothetical protein
LDLCGSAASKNTVNSFLLHYKRAIQCFFLGGEERDLLQDAVRKWIVESQYGAEGKKLASKFPRQGAVE